MWLWLEDGILLTAIGATLLTFAAGLAIGTLAGAAFGITLAIFKPLSSMLEPLLRLAFALPKIALIPLFILWFGVSYRERVLIVVAAVFFLVFYPVYDGMRRMPPSLKNTLVLLGATEWKIARVLYLPATIGWVVESLRLAIPHAFLAVIAAEIVLSPTGLGQLIKTSADLFNTPGMYAAVIAVAALAVSVSVIVDWLSSRSRWKV